MPILFSILLVGFLASQSLFASDNQEVSPTPTPKVLLEPSNPLYQELMNPGNEEYNVREIVVSFKPGSLSDSEKQSIRNDMIKLFDLKKLELKAKVNEGMEIWAFDKDDTPVQVYFTKMELRKNTKFIQVVYHDIFNQVLGYENYPTSAPITQEPINYPTTMRLTLGKIYF